MVSLKGVQDDPFEHFDPFKGAVPLPHQFDFEDVAYRARILLKGWEKADLTEAALAIDELLKEGERLSEQDAIENGTRVVRVEYNKFFARALVERDAPLEISSRKLSYSETYALLALRSVAKACSEQAALTRIGDKTPDLLAEELRRAGERVTSDLAVLAKEAITQAEGFNQMEKQETQLKEKRSHTARRAGLGRKKDVRHYQWQFLKAYDAGEYKGLSKNGAATRFAEKHPVPDDMRLGYPVRSLVRALNKHLKGQFVPPDDI